MYSLLCVRAGIIGWIWEKKFDIVILTNYIPHLCAECGGFLNHNNFDCLCVPYLRPVGEDDRADERPPVRRAPRPMIYRHGRSDSPPFLSEMYELPNAPMPIMYSSVPVKSAALSRRAAKKGREQSDVYTLTSDDDYEL